MKKNWSTEEGETVTKCKDWARFVQNPPKSRLGTWKSIAHHLLHKLSARGKIIKQTRFPRFELIWNLANCYDLNILCVTTDTEKR